MKSMRKRINFKWHYPYSSLNLLDYYAKVGLRGHTQPESSERDFCELGSIDYNYVALRLAIDASSLSFIENDSVCSIDDLLDLAETFSRFLTKGSRTDGAT